MLLLGLFWSSEQLSPSTDMDTPSMQKIDIPTWPQFAVDEIEAVESVLRSGTANSWTGGDVTAFESGWQGVSGCVHAFAMANGTLTIESSIRVLRLDPTAEIIVPARSYIACGSAVLMAGATPVFADVDSRTGCVTTDTLDAARTSRTRAIIVVHLGGWPADMTSILGWAREHGVMVIEDAAQAHGSTSQDERGRSRWAGTRGDFGSWSFCQDKIMSTGGEGGMLAVADPVLADRVWSLRDHGKSRSRVESHIATNRFAWWVDSVGSNLRMTGMQAAIGLVQLRKLDQWIQARTRNAQILRQTLSDIDWLEFPEVQAGHRPSWYRVYASVRPDVADAPRWRDLLLDTIAAAGLPIGVGSCPEIYLEDGLQAWAPSSRLPNARDLGERCLCFPCHHLITAETMGDYADQLADVCHAVDGTRAAVNN
jgi:dTDP-4-amino-4,6-dideoxygalactose transaminase